MKIVYFILSEDPHAKTGGKDNIYDKKPKYWV